MNDLAARAEVSNSTIRDFEAGRRVPIANNMTAMRRALEAEGMELVFDKVGRGTGIAGPISNRVEEKRPPGNEPPRRPARSRRGTPTSGRRRKPSVG